MLHSCNGTQQLIKIHNGRDWAQAASEALYQTEKEQTSQNHL